MAENSLGKYHSASYHMPDLTRPDLTALEEIILKDLRPERYHVACLGFIYDRVDEIPAHDPRPIETLVVYTHAPCLRLKFARSWAELYCEEMDDQIAPAVQRISALVKARERRILWVVAKYSSWVAPMAGFGFLCEGVVMVYAWHAPVVMLQAACAFLLLASIWWSIGYRMTFLRFSRIRL